MAIRDFQRALADMTLDARLAAAVRDRGASALDGYVLTERERHRLATVARQDGMSVNCSLARANRFGSIHDAFAKTCVLLRSQLRDLLDELWSQRRPDNYQLAGEEEAFAALVESRLAEGTLEVPYLAEVFRYERMCWDLAMECRLRDPSAMEGCRRTTLFRHDPGALLDALSRYELPPGDLPAGEHTVSILVRDGDLVAEWSAAIPAPPAQGEGAPL
jgi:hypothetical protein